MIVRFCLQSYDFIQVMYIKYGINQTLVVCCNTQIHL